MQDDKPIVEQILLGVEKMTRTDNKITLCKIGFNLGACKTLSQDEVDSVSDTARNFFRFVQAFGIKLKLRNFVNIWIVEDRLQDLDSSTLNKKTIETLLNEIFVLDNQDKNELAIKKYGHSIDIII